MRHIGIITLLILVFWTESVYSIIPIGIRAGSAIDSTNSVTSNLHRKADNSFKAQNYTEALKAYASILEHQPAQEALIFKRMALAYAALYETDKAVIHIEKYLHSEFDTNFLLNDGFSTIQNSQEFKDLSKKYNPHFSIWSFMYLYVALIGFYIAIMINLNKKTDRVARILISSFIFIHSFFILHICLNITNYQFSYPHTYLMSTSFSFLYGPLLYFYFKRITLQYSFRNIDLLHLIPTVLFLLYIIPIYTMSAKDKLSLILGRVSNGYVVGDSAHVGVIVVLKLTSLIVYGYFIRALYLKSKTIKVLSKENKIWQRNLVIIHLAYIVSYAIYGALISNHMSSGIFYHSQVVAMSLMILYVGYAANVQYNVFNGIYSFANKTFFKYEKSGLTESLSYELKENLINLFDKEKVYKESNICLELLAQKLNTTRHNTSQIINEHFNMSFHELINTYRIQEAKEILNNDLQKNLNIIDVAYEVGYNNKVTFNKAFKKDTNLTPSQYQKNSIYA